MPNHCSGLPSRSARRTTAGLARWAASEAASGRAGAAPVLPASVVERESQPPATATARAADIANRARMPSPFRKKAPRASSPRALARLRPDGLVSQRPHLMVEPLHLAGQLLPHPLHPGHDLLAVAHDRAGQLVHLVEEL